MSHKTFDNDLVKISKTSSTIASQIIWYNKHILVDKRSFYNITLVDKGINHLE